MRSFRVTRIEAPWRRVGVGAWDWDELVALACRNCEDEKGVAGEGTEFVPDAAPKVGQTLHCPTCGEPSVIPKKGRWQ